MDGSDSRYDYRTIKATHPLHEWVKKLNLGEPDKRMMMRCPFHKDDTPSFHLFRGRDGLWRWQCFGGCGSGDLFDLLGRMQFGSAYTGRGDQLAAVVDMVASLGITPISDAERLKREQEYRREDEAKREDARRIRETFYLRALSAHQALRPIHREIYREWGISDEWIDQARLGYDGARFTIPAFYHNVCFGIKRRRHPDDGDEAGPKYNTETGSVWGLYMADLLPEYTDYVIVCEDEKSALALLSHGAQAVASTGGANFWRSQKSEWWAPRFDHIPTLIFWRDADDPGLGCALDFRQRFPRAIIVDSAPFKDAGDYIVAGHDWREVVAGKRITGRVA